MQIKNLRRYKAGFLLMAVVGLFSWAGSLSMNNSEGEEGGTGGRLRSIASSVFSQPRSASVEVEKRWAKKLALTQGRSVASVGHDPNNVESLRFGLLEGKYSFEMQGETIRSLTFVDNPETEGRPTYVKDRGEFLIKYGALFGYDGLPERLSIGVRGHHIIETYRVKTAKGHDGTIEVTLDPSERLIGIKAEEASVARNTAGENLNDKASERELSENKLSDSKVSRNQDSPENGSSEKTRPE